MTAADVLASRHDPAHVGVTSTRAGMAGPQREVADVFLATLRSGGATHLHSGDCLGGDDELQEMAHGHGYVVVAHPGPGSKWRAYGYSDQTRAVQSFAGRNQTIVWESGTLIGCPPTEHELLRSGTWQTIRMGWKAGIRVVVIAPSGAETDTIGRPS